MCGTNGAEPAIDNPDYKADLEAVNLGARISGSSSSLFSIVNAYYSSIYSLKSDHGRAYEFIENIGYDTLHRQLMGFEGYVMNNIFIFNYETGQYAYPLDDPEKLEEYHEKIYIFQNFMENLEKGNNNWEENLVKKD